MNIWLYYNSNLNQLPINLYRLCKRPKDQNIEKIEDSFWFSLKRSVFVFIVCFLCWDPKTKKHRGFWRFIVLEHCQKQKIHVYSFWTIWCLVLPLQTFAFRKFMNAPSTLYSAQNPEIAFANVCKREGIQDSRFKIQKKFLNPRFQTTGFKFWIQDSRTYFWILHLES